MRRIFLITVLTLVVLFAITLGVGWYLLNDEAFLKSQVSDLSMKYTGRELVIQGPLKLELGRETTLHAGEIHFANAEWADQPDMVAIGKLMIRADIRSLFSDKPTFPAIVLDNCMVLLERNANGEANWDVLPESDIPLEPEKEKSPPDDLPLWVQDIKIHSCEVILAGPELEKPLNIKIDDLATQHHDDNRWAAQGSGNVNKEEMKFDGWLMPFAAVFAGGPAEHQLQFSLGDLVTLNSSGTVQDLSVMAGANITAQLKGPEIADILNEFKLPLFSEGAFDYRLSLNSEGEMTKLDLSGDFGSAEIYAKGELDRLIKPTKGTVEISGVGPNLGALARILGVDGLVEERFEHATHATFKGDAIHLKQSFLKTERDHLEIGGHFNIGSGFAGTELDVHFESEEVGRWLKAAGLAEQTIGPFTLDGKLNSDSAGLFTVTSNVINQENKLDVQGTLGHLPGGIAPDLELEFNSPDPSALANLAGLKNFPAAPFAVKGHLGWKDKQLKLDKVNIDLAGDQANIDGLLSLENNYAGSEIIIGIDIKNAGDLGRLFGKDGLPDQAIKLNGEVKPEGKGLAFDVSDGKLGKIKIQLNGRIVDMDHPLGIDANFDFALPMLSDVSFLLADIKLPAAPFSARGRIDTKDMLVTLEKVTVNLADNKANIDGHINLADHYAGSKLNLDLDIKNTAEFGQMFGKEGLPNQALSLTASVQPDKKGLAFQVSDGNFGEIQLDLNGHMADLEKPTAVSADFHINLPRFSDISFLLPKTKLPDAPFSAKGRFDSNDKRVTFEEVTVNLADNRADIHGQINHADRYIGSKLNFDLNIKNAAEFGRMFGKDDLPNQPLSLTASIQPDKKGLAFRVSDGNFGEIQLDLNGLIPDLESPEAMSANFDIKLPSLDDISFLFPGRDLPDAPFTASGRLVNQQSRSNLDNVKILIGKMKASIDGDLLPDNGFQLSVTAAGPDASRLGEVIGTSLPANPFTVSAALKGNPKKFSLNGLNVGLGPSKIAGNLVIGLGAITLVHGNIDSPYLDLSHWYQGKQDQQEPEEETTRTVKKEWMFDDTPLIVSADQKLDLDLDLKVDQLALGNTTIEDIALGFRLSDSLIQVKPFALKGTRGGVYSGEVSLDGSSGIPRLHVELDGKDVRLGLAAAPGQDPATYPPIDIDVFLDGAGATRRQLVSSLSGRYRSFLGSGQFASAGLDLLFSDFLTQLFNTLNPFAQTSEYTNLDCAVMAADAENGIVTVFPVIFHTEQLTILSEGTVDLNTEKIDLSFNTKPRTGLGISAGTLINPLIKVGGRLTTPAVEMDPENTIKSGGLAVVTLGISVLAKSMSDRFLSSKDPCGDARKELAKRDSINK